jgi:hypothetical protein
MTTDGTPPRVSRGLGESPVIGWELADGARCTIAAVGGSFEVCLVSRGVVVQVRRFATPGPAFDAARAWRRGIEPCSEEGE